MKKLVLSGWTDDQSELPSATNVYWNFRDELIVEKGIIFKGDKPVIPPSMRSEMLQKIHESHLVIEKFWPGMSKQIAEVVGRCKVCQEHRHSYSEEPFIPHEVPDRPWSKIESDLFHLRGENYLLLVDYYSEFIEISKLADTRSETVVNHCKSQFARYGIPDILITDNGP